MLAVIAAGCVPSFIVQYRQRLGGRLDQVLADLAPFQAIADREQGGSIAALVRYHLASTDPTFHREGAALQAMIDAVARLRAMMSALNTDLFHQSLYLLGHPDADVLRETWRIYQPGFTITPQSLLFAFVAGVVVWIAFLAVWHLSAWLIEWVLLSRPRSRSRPA